MDDLAHHFNSNVEKCRHDGWTENRRRFFLESLANGHPVERACAHVGMSKVSAYALRRRDAAFALAWSNAQQSCRPEIVAPLPNPALADQVSMVTRKNGTAVRRPDNLSTLTQLSRIDRQVARLDMAGGNRRNIKCLSDAASRRPVKA